MAVLSIAIALKIAASCAVGVAPQTLLSVAHVETGLSEFDVGDNTTHRSYRPGTLPEAIALATKLIGAGHSVDLGIAQINSAAGHLQKRGLPIAAAFDPCIGFRVGGEVFAECYGRTSGADEQARLKQAASCYNTGTLDRGAQYAARVWRAAALVVPAIQVAGTSSILPSIAGTSVPLRKAPHQMLAMEDGLHGSTSASTAEASLEGALQLDMTRKDME